MKRWLVIGAGPCGIASIACLLESQEFEVLWVDPCFKIGRMGKYYRNVPANTPNNDLIYAFHLCKSFDFDNQQDLRRIRDPDRQVLSDLEPESSALLGYFIDALEDSTKVLMNQTINIQGVVNYAEYSSLKKAWEVRITTKDETEEDLSLSVDALILACGCKPSMIEWESSLNDQSNRIISESLDKFVDPNYVSQLFARDANYAEKVWCVVGTSHSAMLVLMNLVNAGAKNIINIYRSEEFRFQHYLDDGSVRYPGVGLKGPVGEWVRNKFSIAGIKRVRYHSIVYGMLFDIFSFAFVRFEDGVDWDGQLLLHCVDHVIFAIGFERYLPHMKNESLKQEIAFPYIAIDGFPVTVKDYDSYNIDTGEISSIGRLFGVGIAFPSHHHYEDGSSEPWVGFKRSIQQTSRMIDRFYKEENNTVTT